MTIANKAISLQKVMILSLPRSKIIFSFTLPLYVRLRWCTNNLDSASFSSLSMCMCFFFYIGGVFEFHYQAQASLPIIC